MTAPKTIQPTPDHEVDRLKALGGQLNENPIWHEALDKMRAQYIELFETSKPVAAIDREHAYLMLQAINGLRGEIQAFAQAGKLSRGVAEKNVKRS